MRTLVIGDIHGYLHLLDHVLEMSGYRDEDKLITLGDYVDRGPDSKGVIDRLIEIQLNGNLIPIRGNHDVMMVDARTNREACGNWYYCGGWDTIRSYGLEEPGDFSKVPESHWLFLEEDLLDWYELDSHFFVHANAYPDYPLEDQPSFMLHWEHLYNPRPHSSGKIMVCGHTKQSSGRPLVMEHTICLDTWVYGNGYLTCLDLDTGRYWQAGSRETDNGEEIEEREGHLDEGEVQ